jgi:hypothetical protein
MAAEVAAMVSLCGCLSIVKLQSSRVNLPYGVRAADEFNRRPLVRIWRKKDSAERLTKGFHATREIQTFQDVKLPFVDAGLIGRFV